MSAAIHKALKNSAWQTLGGLAITGSNFLQMLVLARVLGPEQFGAFVTSQAQVLVWMLLVDLGLSSGLIGALTDLEARAPQAGTLRLVGAALLVRLAGALLGALLIFLLAFATHGGGFAPGFWQDVAYTPYLFSWAFQQTAVSYATYRGRQGLSVAAATSVNIASVILSISLVLQGVPLAWVLFLQSLWCFFAAAWIFAAVGAGSRASEGGTSLPVWGPLWQNCWPYALVFAALTAWGRVDQIVTSRFLGLEAGGQYGLAARLVAIPVLLATSITFAIFPDLQRLGRDAPEKIPVYTGALLKILFRFGLPAAFVFLYTVAFAILPLVPKFQAAVQLLPWFALGVWAYWMHSFATNAFWGSRRYREIVLAHLYALVVYLLAIVPLVMLFGNRGAALAYDLFGLVLLGSAVAYMRRTGVLNRDFRFLAPFSREEAELFRRLQEKFWKRKTAN